MVDVVDSTGEYPFIWCDDAASHVLWRKPGIGPGGGDYRYADTWEEVDRCAQHRQYADTRDEDRHNDKRQRLR